MEKSWKLTEKQSLFVKHYLSGCTQDEAARLSGYNRRLGVNTVRKLGLLRPRGSLCRKYHFTFNYFEDINSEEKAYWLGFITADGWVNKNSVGISLKHIDRSHLQKFLESIKHEEVITDKDKFVFGKTFRLSTTEVHCKKMVEDLAGHNVVPNKSLKSGISERVERELLRHYWRGLFDGDGCIGKSGSRWHLTLCGNEQIIKSFELFMGCQIGSNAKPIKNGKIYYLAYSGNRVIKRAVDILYKDSSIYLDRKMKLVQRFNEELLKRVGS